MHKLLAAYSVSAACSWVALFIFPVSMLACTNSAIYTAASYAVEFLPYVVVTPFAGVIGDHYNKKKILQFGEIFAGILCIILGFFDHASVSVYILFLLQFLLSAVVAVHHPIFQSIIPRIVHHEKISRFNSYISTIDSIVSIGAPIVGGLLFTVLTKEKIWQVIGSGYLLSAFVINNIRYDHEKSAQIFNLRYVLQSLEQGFVYVMNHSLIKSLLLLFVGVNLGLQIFYSNYVFILKNTFAVAENNLSYYFVPAGLCSIIAALISPNLLKKFKAPSIIRITARTQGLLLLSLAIMKNLISLVLIWSLISGCTTIIVITFFTLRQEFVEKNILSRVVAISRMLAYLSVPIGALLGGYILSIVGDYLLVVMLGGAVVTISSFILKSDVK